MSEFLYQLLSVGVVEQAAVATINPNLSNDFHPRVATDAQEAGVDIPVSDCPRCRHDATINKYAGVFRSKIMPRSKP